MNVLTYINAIIKKVAPNILAMAVIWGMINYYPIFMGASITIYYMSCEKTLLE